MTARALDDLDGGDETVAVAHAAMGGDYGGGVSATLSVAVADDDPRLVALAATSTLAGLDENDSATYTVALSTQPTGPVTVAIASSDTSAATVDADDAVGGLQGTVTFTASTWNTARTVTVSALDDDDGFDETITLTHDPSGADYESGVSNATFAFTLDDDDPRGVVLSTSTLSVQENGSATYTVQLRTQPVGGNVTVTITGAGGGIAPNPTSLTFNGANWNTPQQVRVSAARDGDSMDETATLTHTPSGAGTDYAAGAATAQIVVTATDIDTPGLQVSPTQLAVAEGASRAYTVRLNTDPLGAVTVTATSNDAAVTLDADSTPQERTLTFNASNWATPQTVTASAVEDDNGTDESATLTHAASGAAAYTGLAGGALPSVQVAVDDNDARALVIDADPSTNDIDAGPLAVDENSSKEYTVRLSTQPTGPVTVTATSPDAALAVDSDASPQTRTLTFTTSTWATSQTVTARALDDDDGGNETVAIAHAALGGDYGGGVSATLSVAVADDDPRLVTLTATSTLAGLDENDSGTYTVALSTRPTGAGDGGDLRQRRERGDGGRGRQRRRRAGHGHVHREHVGHGADGDRLGAGRRRRLRRDDRADARSERRGLRPGAERDVRVHAGRRRPAGRGSEHVDADGAGERQRHLHREAAHAAVGRHGHRRDRQRRRRHHGQPDVADVQRRELEHAAAGARERRRGRQLGTRERGGAAHAVRRGLRRRAAGGSDGDGGGQRQGRACGCRRRGWRWTRTSRRSTRCG